MTFLGVFGNVATFSAGVIPMQSCYLRRCGLIVGSGVGTMTLEYVFYKTAILVYAAFMLLLQGRWFHSNGEGLARYLIWGYVICALIIAGLILACTWDKVQRLACWGIDRLPDSGKWQSRKKLWKENLAALMCVIVSALPNVAGMGPAALS